MAVTVQMQLESVVTEIYQDAFVGSSIENGTTIIQFDLRKLAFLIPSDFVVHSFRPPMEEAMRRLWSQLG
jgi:hypothetical protein